MRFKDLIYEYFLEKKKKLLSILQMKLWYCDAIKVESSKQSYRLYYLSS